MKPSASPQSGSSPRSSTLSVRFSNEEIERMRKWQKLLGVNSQQILHWAYNSFKEGVMTPIDQPLKVNPQLSAVRHAVQSSPENYQI